MTDYVLTDELDLHTFQPSECADLVDEYVRAAHEAGFTTVRIIHGKGTGTLRRIVHSVLDKHPLVARYEVGGNWGATTVVLHGRDEQHEQLADRGGDGDGR